MARTLEELDAYVEAHTDNSSNPHSVSSSQSGITYVVKQGSNFEILAKNELEDGNFASPAIVGDELFILEAMKMRNIIKSTLKGTIESINVKVGEQVTKGQIIIKFKDD